MTNKEKILEYLIKNPGWHSPTLIGNIVGGKRGSSWASPLCLGLVAMGKAERSKDGHYRLMRRPTARARRAHATIERMCSGQVLQETKSGGEKKILLGYCGVDSGQIIITDPCYISRFKMDRPPNTKVKRESVRVGNGVVKGYPYSYSGACGAANRNPRPGKGQLINMIGAKMGVCVESGFGDGVYEVYAYLNKEGMVTRVEVIFIKEK